jgi:hypothetical protein
MSTDQIPWSNLPGYLEWIKEQNDLIEQNRKRVKPKVGK